MGAVLPKRKTLDQYEGMVESGDGNKTGSRDVMCPICRSIQNHLWKKSDSSVIRPEDLAITDKRYGMTFEIRECECGFRFAPPSATDQLLELYKELDDPAYELGRESRLAQQSSLLQRLRELMPASTSLLDVGAANGMLVDLAGRAGLRSVGVEPSESLAAAARMRGLDVRTGTLPMKALESEKFDLVACVDVIEHVAEPLALLHACRTQLNPNGKLLIVTPDAASFAARILGKRWWHLRLAHVGYFTPSTLAYALNLAGFEVELQWRPGWSFEIGYLAERVGSYIPGASWLADRSRQTRLMGETVPLNLFDSIAVVARLAH